jgi:hypothetical protein
MGVSGIPESFQLSKLFLALLELIERFEFQREILPAIFGMRM